MRNQRLVRLQMSESKTRKLTGEQVNPINYAHWETISFQASNCVGEAKGQLKLSAGTWRQIDVVLTSMQRDDIGLASVPRQLINVTLPLCG